MLLYLSQGFWCPSLRFFPVTAAEITSIYCAALYNIQFSVTHIGKLHNPNPQGAMGQYMLQPLGERYIAPYDLCNIFVNLGPEFLYLYHTMYPPHSSIANILTFV